ncbi:hypothetical protein BE221DRAFT_187717 [Ostreococcus tauri]|uniref:Uncharacterized protein n=1 Tax=Ostreococcus tauri TaxID=70448 RepID=A0A1Y5I7E4_OSTTA|nr:hypothetical protein BE221DRAFT_187717 [Ostreococcus tauri]
MGSTFVTVREVQRELERLGREDIDDDVVARYLVERRRRGRGDGEENGGRARAKDARGVDFDFELSDEDDDGRRTTGATARCGSFAVATPMDRPPWNGDAFETVNAPSRRFHADALPRRKHRDATTSAIDGRCEDGQIDVVRVGAMYRQAWENAPDVVRDERRPKIGFAQKFAEEHAKENAQRNRLLGGRRRYNY